MLPKLALDIDETQYSISPGNEINEVGVEAGPVWRRQDFLGAPNKVSLKLVLTPFAYSYFMAFYRSTLVRGLLPFLIDLVIDSNDMTEYQAKILAGTLSATRSGTAHIVTATLEVKRNSGEADQDESLIALFDAFGDYAPLILDKLSGLVEFYAETEPPIFLGGRRTSSTPNTRI